MRALEIISRETAQLGYQAAAIRRDYVYGDVWTQQPETRSIPFAAFTQTPPSYRSAAFGAVIANGRDPASTVNDHRSLGAPLMFALREHEVSTWQIYGSGPPRMLQRGTLEELPAYFRENRKTWSPDAIHRAKSIGKVEQRYQLDFVDVGLITAIEGEIHKKLDYLLQEALVGIDELSSGQVRYLFRGVFRLLAAKILMDRRHHRAAYWDNAEVESVLDVMGDFYKLGSNSQNWPSKVVSLLQPAWMTICRGLNVANISADDLAFVYEHTLVTPKTRKEFGTHSTPRHVADYILSRLRLWEYGEKLPLVFEPFTGAGVFLVSALRHLKDGLPLDWSDRKRHNRLVRRVKGAEIDPFACEVAKLSLILADYPNANGWMIEEANLFKGNALSRRMKSADVILRNPPFESFSDKERKAWPEAAALSPSRVIFALESALRAQPEALGFVVPRALLVDRRYKAQRVAIEAAYREVELVSLPDGVFNVSQADTALLIARDRLNGSASRRIVSSEVNDSQIKKFAITGLPTVSREESRDLAVPITGSLWLPPLASVWSRLRRNHRLSEFLEGHWGLRWKSHQSLRSRAEFSSGWKRGLLNSFDHRQFRLGQASWVDTRANELYGAGDLPWDEPKILCNAGRLSRRYWRLAAAVDREGLVASQQFIGLWEREGSNIDLDAFAALLNGPVVNAYLAEHSFDKRFRIRTLLDAPIPRHVPEELGRIAREYAVAAADESVGAGKLQKLLGRIDATVLAAYELPEEMERDLLSAFQGSERPTVSHHDIPSLAVPAKLKQGDLGLDRGRERLLFDYFGPVEHSVGAGLGDPLSRKEALTLLTAYAQDVPTDSWAGRTVRLNEAAEALGVSIAQLTSWRRRGALVALRERNRSLTYPLEQFRGQRPIPGLRRVIEAVGDVKSAWLWLRQPHGALDERIPLDILSSGDVGQVVKIAKRDFG